MWRWMNPEKQRYYSFTENDFGVGRQSLADKRRERIPALRKELSEHLYLADLVQDQH